jgi:UDP-2,3-diacylglucosamine hydrolase
MFHNRTLQRMFAAIHPRWSMDLGLTWAKHSRMKRVDGKEPDYMGENKEFWFSSANSISKSIPTSITLFTDTGTLCWI